MKTHSFITLKNGKKVKIKQHHKHAHDMKHKQMVKIQNPKVVTMKNGRKAISGTSPITGHKVFKIVG